MDWSPQWRRAVEMLSHKLACIIGRVKQVWWVTQFAIWYQTHSHMHLYFGIARAGNYSLNHFSGTHGISPSENSSTQFLFHNPWHPAKHLLLNPREIHLCFPLHLKPINNSFFTDPQVELKGKNKQQQQQKKKPLICTLQLFKETITLYLKSLIINCFQWYIRFRKEDESSVHV